jgi:hypothetical protein
LTKPRCSQLCRVRYSTPTTRASCGNVNILASPLGSTSESVILAT